LLATITATALAISLAWLGKAGMLLLFLLGLSLVIFFHELGHFLAAKWCGVKIEKFAIGFGKELLGFTRGETRYSINALPLGGYVKMLGQEDFTVDKSGELVVKSDPRSYPHKPVGQRMLIVSAGVIMNVIFAAVFFTIAFLMGLEVMPPKVGTVLPDTPAFRAGLKPGDKIIAINDRRMTEWTDIMMSIVLSDPGKPLRVTVRRDGKILNLQVEPEYNEYARVRQIGIGNPQTLTIAYAGWAGGPEEGRLQVGDVIVALNGRPVKDVNEVLMAISAAAGKPVTLTVERTLPDGTKKRVTVSRRARITMLPVETPNLLGAVPRVRIGEIKPDSPADLAGLREGDVIIEWDGIVNPTWKQISENVLQNFGFDIPVRVIRAGKVLERTLLVRPEKPFTWTGKAKPQIGVTYRGEIDEEHLVVAAVLPDSPMARAGLVRGAVIKTVNGQSLRDWFDLIDALKKYNGQTVEIGFEVAGELRKGRLRVPRSICAELGITPFPHGSIISIAGQRAVKVVEPDGRIVSYSVSYWRGTQAALKQHIGQEVEIRYQVGAEIKTARGLVTDDLTDPWYMRIWFIESFITYPEKMLLRTANPVKAVWWGLKRTGYFLIQAYITIKQMVFTQQIGVENIRGPVGIVRIGAKIAEAGLAQLIYFLAFLSANFAVINFLPLPIVDGGHFMFLIIEKIKGKPLSLRVQMITQIIGLALIFGAFIFLTIQDIIMWNK